MEQDSEHGDDARLRTPNTPNTLNTTGGSIRTDGVARREEPTSRSNWSIDGLNVSHMRRRRRLRYAWAAEID